MFELTHDIEAGFGSVNWRRTAWPRSGGFDQQDIKTVEALELIRSTYMQVYHEQRQRKAEEDALAEWREERQEGRRRGTV